MKKSLILLVCLTLVLNSVAFAGVGSNKAAYMGGSTKEKDFPGLKKQVEGMLDTGNETTLKFSYKLKNEPREFSIPYDRIIDIEYGQKAGRRVGAAIGTTILLGPIGLLLLMSKKRKHYVTIGYKDETDKEQVAVFELGKDLIRTTLPILETRSGKKIEYQDESARKAREGK
jgi:hypothetical protein